MSHVPCPPYFVVKTEVLPKYLQGNRRNMRHYIWIESADNTLYLSFRGLLKDRAYFQSYLCSPFRVICVGGDGMFSELLHGVIGRTQQEAGISEHDPAVMLQPCDLHIGIIPAGESLHCSVTDMRAEEDGDCGLFIALMHGLDSERSVSLPPCVYSSPQALQIVCVSLP